ncbi:MAG: formyltransferase family protein [Pseudomonadota bacterium]
MISSKNFAIVASTSGSVVSRVLAQDPVFRAQTKLVVTDRACGAEDVAHRYDIPCHRIDEPSPLAFGNKLLETLELHAIDYAFIFFSRLIQGYILEKLKHRLINIHPSLLPAFPGMGSFEKAWASNALFTGSTTHFIDQGIDTGAIIQQSIVRIDRPHRTKGSTRHELFLQQCASLSQVALWLSEERIRFTENNRIEVLGSQHSDASPFMPALEHDTPLRLLASEF